MVVGQHLPEAVKGFGRNPEAELGNISFEKGAYEFLPPTAGNFFARGQQTVGKSAAQPELGQTLRAHFREAQGREFNVGDATGQGFAGLAKEQR